jgi:hypothetical protein
MIKFRQKILIWIILKYKNTYSLIHSYIYKNQSISNFFGFLQNLGLCISPIIFVPTIVPFLRKYGPNWVFYLTCLANIPTAGGHILKH